MSCEECSPMDHWEQEEGAPRKGHTYFQHQVNFFLPEAKDEKNRLMQIWVEVRYLGTPPKTYGMGAYEITRALGWEHLEGTIWGIGYDRVIP